MQRSRVSIGSLAGQITSNGVSGGNMVGMIQRLRGGAWTRVDAFYEKSCFLIVRSICTICQLLSVVSNQLSLSWTVALFFCSRALGCWGNFEDLKSDPTNPKLGVRHSRIGLVTAPTDLFPLNGIGPLFAYLIRSYKYLKKAREFGSICLS